MVDVEIGWLWLFHQLYYFLLPFFELLNGWALDRLCSWHFGWQLGGNKTTCALTIEVIENIIQKHYFILSVYIAFFILLSFIPFAVLCLALLYPLNFITTLLLLFRFSFQLWDDFRILVDDAWFFAEIRLLWLIGSAALHWRIYYNFCDWILTWSGARFIVNTCRFIELTLLIILRVFLIKASIQDFIIIILHYIKSKLDWAIRDIC